MSQSSTLGAAPLAAPGGRWPAWALRVTLVALLLYGGLGTAGETLLRQIAPAQKAVLTALMPDFDLYRFGVVQRGPHLKLAATLINRRYLVMQGRAHAPGIGFDVETPARTALLYGTLIAAGALLPRSASGGWRRCALAVGVALFGAALLTVIAQPVVLAGQVWGLGITSTDEPTLSAVMVALSNFLLHGGGYGLCAAIVWLALRISRPIPAKPADGASP